MDPDLYCNDVNNECYCTKASNVLAYVSSRNAVLSRVELAKKLEQKSMGDHENPGKEVCHWRIAKSLKFHMQSKSEQHWRKPKTHYHTPGHSKEM